MRHGAFSHVGGCDGHRQLRKGATEDLGIGARSADGRLCARVTLASSLIVSPLCTAVDDPSHFETPCHSTRNSQRMPLSRGEPAQLRAARDTYERSQVRLVGWSQAWRKAWSRDVSKMASEKPAESPFPNHSRLSPPKWVAEHMHKQPAPGMGAKRLLRSIFGAVKPRGSKRGNSLSIPGSHALLEGAHLKLPQVSHHAIPNAFHDLSLCSLLKNRNGSSF